MADKGSDEIYDYSCNVCEEDNLNKEALFFCQQCSKGYCGKCIDNHKQLFKKHQPFGRKELNKWPAVKTAMDLMQNCQQHPDNRIELFCEDHKKLCCLLCHLHDHKSCTKKMIQIAEKAKKMNQSDVRQLTATIDAEQKKLEKEIDMANECVQKLQEAYDRAHEEIGLFRKKINDLLDKLETNTVQSLDALLKKLKEAIKSDIEICAKLKEDFKHIHEVVKRSKENKPNVQIFIAQTKSAETITQAQALLKQTSAHRNVDITFQGNPDVEQYLSRLSDLGNVEGTSRRSEIRLPAEIIKCNGKTLHNVKLASDKQSCHIYGICELPSGELLMVDSNNCNLKLLDMQYKVISHLDLAEIPRDICSISPTEVAVTYDKGTIQFITVHNKNIVVGRKLKFEHGCFGIAHYKGSLYVTSCTALYQYTLNGKLVKMIYEDTSNTVTVYKCAVSADGSRLFVTNYIDNKLLTLSMEGTVLYYQSLEDPALRRPTGVQLSETGQLFVCGLWSDNVVQVDGRGRVVTLASKEDGLNGPECVYYSARTGRLIVGHTSDNILVINTT